MRRVLPSVGHRRARGSPAPANDLRLKAERAGHGGSRPVPNQGEFDYWIHRTQDAHFRLKLCLRSVSRKRFAFSKTSISGTPRTPPQNVQLNIPVYVSSRSGNCFPIFMRQGNGKRPALPIKKHVLEIAARDSGNPCKPEAPKAPHQAGLLCATIFPERNPGVTGCHMATRAGGFFAIGINSMSVLPTNTR